MLDINVEIRPFSAEELTEMVDMTFWKAVIFLHQPSDVSKAVSEINKSFDLENSGPIKVFVEQKTRSTCSEGTHVTPSFEDIWSWYPFMLNFQYRKEKKGVPEVPKPCMFVFDFKNDGPDEEDYLWYKMYAIAKKVLELLGTPCFWPGDDELFGTRFTLFNMVELNPSYMIIFARNDARDMLTRYAGCISIFMTRKLNEKALIVHDENVSIGVLESIKRTELKKRFFQLEEGHMCFGYMLWGEILKELNIIEIDEVPLEEKGNGFHISALFWKMCCKPKANKVTSMDM